ncbi:MAG: DUF5320 domain-containing protein [Candidatus Hermodarchaeota archaeon]
MPSGDRTGPGGLGPMTGRALGYCAGYDTPGFTKGPGWEFGCGWGRGRGWWRGRGIGYGKGWGWGYSIPVYTPYTLGIAPQITSESQLSMLKEEKSYLESEMNGIKNALEDISKRIGELEKEE